MMKSENSINRNPENGNLWNEVIAYKEADWYVSYDHPSDNTALVISGADGIGVLFIILRGDHREEFMEVVNKYDGFNKGINGCLGECIRFAAAHPDLIPEKSTIGGWHTKLGFRSLERKDKFKENKYEDHR